MSTMIVPPGFAKKVQEDMEEYRSDIAANSEAIGDTQLPTTAQTLTGAVAEHEGDLTEHQTAISKILPVISGSTNNSGYAINKDEYFEANGKLYKATASIPKNQAWSSSATEQGDSVHGALNGAFDSLNSNIVKVGSLKNEATDTTGVFNVSSLTGHVGIYCMDVSITEVNTDCSYVIPESIVAHGNTKIWVSEGFLQTTNGTLPVNFHADQNYISCWYENGSVHIKSNAWTGTAYVVLKYVY